MASPIRIDYEAALAQANVVETLANDVKTILTNLVEDVERSIGNEGVWTGESATNFKNTWERCSEDFYTYVNHINTIRNKMIETYEQVRKFENGL